ncbi:M23 family metallopeptidase [Campylobacter geochelonis]|uniref:M24/M37 family peptidase n=1 Tax=Campylobacter geochelonis TaxID=1780362 RepID=A0A128EJL6_9BACT|nr:M23 family metallopeptidase [Campylobacter geochelonis]QKF71119.1 zinc metallopeptidase, M23 family [Campylobacter geochelonis]CZE48926.1 M24/M37 family peptidase [Campylobacter geochelonis]
MKNLLILLILVSNLLSYEIVNGDVEILKVDKNSAGKLYIDKKELFWFTNPANKDEKVAFVSSNYRAKNDIVVKSIVDDKEQILTFKVIKGDYKQEKLTVEKSKVKPPKTVQERIKKELEEANKIYLSTTKTLLFNSKFTLPINSKITSDFGNARVFNNTLSSYHSGTDFRAAVGSTIKACNSGVVKLAKDRYYAGGSVVIDHGAGIYSQYYHLSKIGVKVGQTVKKGEVIGLSGASGRVNGPHLHFGIIVNGNSVNPTDFIEKINFALFDR